MATVNFDRWAANTLFSEESLRNWLERRERGANDEIEQWDPAEVQFSPEAVAAELSRDFALEPVGLLWDEISRSPIKEVEIEVADQFSRRSVTRRGRRITVTVPVFGNAEAFRYKASTSTTGGYPRGSIQSGQLVVAHESLTLTADEVAKFVQSLQSNFEKYCAWTNRDIEQWSTGLEERLLRLATARKHRLDETAALEAAVEIPLRHASQERRVPVPVSRKRVPPPKARPQGASRPAPVLDEGIYQEVVEMIRHVGNTVERLPGTASKFKEEEWRDLLLFILNANFEGGATGEAFNGQGKTDILLRHEDRNAFIGECKVWRGPKAFGEALDQLLGYTVWRDSKAALVLFIRQADPSAVIEKALTALREHQHFVTEKPSRDSASRSDFLVRSAVDPDRTISVAFLPVVIGRAGSAQVANEPSE